MPYVTSPRTGRPIKVGSATYNRVFHVKDVAGMPAKSPKSPKPTSLKQRLSKKIEKAPTRSKGSSHESKWARSGIPEHLFCGSAGGSSKHSYPVNTPQRARSALSYARFSPNPEKLRECVYRKAKEQGFLRPDGSIAVSPGRKSPTTRNIKTRKSPPRLSMR